MSSAMPCGVASLTSLPTILSLVDIASSIAHLKFVSPPMAVMLIPSTVKVARRVPFILCFIAKSPRVFARSFWLASKLKEPILPITVASAPLSAENLFEVISMLPRTSLVRL